MTIKDVLDATWLTADLPCHENPERWTSDDPDERAEAKDICLTSCDFVRECRQLRRSLRARWGIWGGEEASRRKTGRRSCQYGHLWTPENTGHTRAGRRYCLACAGETIPTISTVTTPEQPTLFEVEQAS